MKEFSDINGTLCVRMSDTNYLEPYLIISDFPTELRTNDFMRNFDIKSLNELQITYEHSYGIFSFIHKKSLCGPTWKVQLINGEKTKSINFLKVPVPCPKVRGTTLTRWNNGRWEKCLKSGWCTA